MVRPVYQSRKEVLNRLGIGNTTLYRWLNEGHFPKPVRLANDASAGNWKTSKLGSNSDRMPLNSLLKYHSYYREM